jgi:3-oxoacyl-[acyl-carrier protein] reductase
VSLHDSTILVTNAAADPGLACAHRLAAAGAGVVISAADEESLLRTEGDLQQHAVPVYGFLADIARGREVEALLGEALRVFGGLDAAVVVPAAPATDNLLELTDEALDRGLADGIRAVSVVCQRAARVMTARGGGSLVLVGPVAGEPGGLGPAGAALHGALRALALELAVELAPHGVAVNAIVGGVGNDRAQRVAAQTVFLLEQRRGGPSGAVIDLGGLETSPPASQSSAL